MAAQTARAEVPRPGDGLPKNEANPKETRAEGADRWWGGVGALDAAVPESNFPPTFPVTQANDMPL